MTGQRWVDLPLGGEALHEIVFRGSGKNAEMTISLADGRAYMLGISELSLAGHAGLTVRTAPAGDLSLEVRYSGEGLAIGSARIALMDVMWEELFAGDVADWLAAPGPGERLYAVSAEIALVPHAT